MEKKDQQSLYQRPYTMGNAKGKHCALVRDDDDVKEAA